MSCARPQLVGIESAERWSHERGKSEVQRARGHIPEAGDRFREREQLPGARPQSVHRGGARSGRIGRRVRAGGVLRR